MLAVRERVKTIVTKAAAFCGTRGRVAFEDMDGEKCAPTQGQVFFYYGDNVDDFRAVFGEIGFIR